VPSSTLVEGQTFGQHYRVEAIIGRGGMGEVYAAENTRTGRKVALKVVRSADVTPEQRRRFLREAKAATAIDHPNVIDVLDVFEEGNIPVMVMELLNGSSLNAVLNSRGTLSLEETASIIVPVTKALKAAHDKGIVHRDLKPDNIFLDRQRDGAVVPKVLDFGIAKVLDPGAISAETEGAATNTGSLMGTPHYMSFEQAMSEKDIDHRADVWSLGVILHEMLVGRRPFEFDNLGQMYTQFLQGEVPSIGEAMPSLPTEVREVIDRCLKKDRADRLGDVEPLITALAPHAGGVDLDGIASAASTGATAAPSQTPGTAAPVATSAVRGSSSRWGAMAVGLLLIGGVAFALVTRQGDEPPAEADLAAPSQSESAPMPPSPPEPAQAISAASQDEVAPGDDEEETAVAPPPAKTATAKTPWPRPVAVAPPPSATTAEAKSEQPPEDKRRPGIVPTLPPGYRPGD
jgi:eukaryotic-like serine/threonine-protein kinase